MTWIPRAREAGAEFRTRARVVEVLTEGDRATGVVYVDGDGERRTIEARLVVLAGFTIETPRLLLASGDGGIANSSGLVGRYVHGHVGGLVYGIFDEDTRPAVGIYGGELLCQERYSAGAGPPGGWSWLIANAVKPNSLIGAANSRPGISGPRLQPFLRRASRGLAAMTLLAHGTSVPSNRLTLLDERDEAGMPRARLVHDFDDDALARFEAATEEGRQTMRAAGATDAWAGDLTVIHMMGGTIMGDDPARSVTNGYGQTHDIPNLVIAGAGLYPTGGAVNPTFTLLAVASRTADFLSENWSQLA